MDGGEHFKVDDPKVVADGIGDGGARGDLGPRWGWLAAGVMIGFGLSFVVLSANNVPSGATQATVPDVVTEEVEAEGVGEAVPGFKDGLVAVTSTDGQNLNLTVWPVAGPFFERDVPLGTAMMRDQVHFDASARRIAALGFVPGEAFSGLMVGVPEAVRLVDIGVTGLAWHDSLPGNLAYTTFGDGVTSLWQLDIADSEPRLLETFDDVSAYIVAWGDWGYALQESTRPRVRVLNEDAQLRRIDDGIVLDSHPDGLIALAAEEVLVVGAVAGVQDFDDRFSVLGTPITAEFSPNGRKLAVMGETGLLVLAVEGDSATVRAEPRNGVAQIAWSSDSRFIVIPGVRGVTLLDTRGSRLDFLLGDRTAFGVATLPISD